jgi:hypothetical protein
MKKFSFRSATTMIIVAVALFLSCQKEQGAVANDPAATDATMSEGAVIGKDDTGPLQGAIQSAYATALAENYKKKYGNNDEQSQSVAFSAKDLIKFIGTLKTKYKSDIIYVNFGVYGKGAAPVNAKDYGRLTVFFTGNKIPGTSSSVRRDGISEFNDADQFLNHGGIAP